MPSEFLKAKRSLPHLGVGLGLRGPISRETFAHKGEIDWLEFTPENYLGLQGGLPQSLERAASTFPLVSHGVNLSVGSVDPLNMDYLRQLKPILDELDVPWWSDHLCFASIDSVYFGDLMPLQWSRESVHHVVERVKRAQDFIGRPFLIENITYYAKLIASVMEEAEFISSVVEGADCGLLLDINNVYVNSVNHQFDPFAFLSMLPLERVTQIHMAGHARVDKRLIDTHGAQVIEPVFDLLDFTLKRADVNAVMIERDQYFGCFNEIVDDLKEIRRLLEENRGLAVTAPAQADERSIDRLPDSPINLLSPRDETAFDDITSEDLANQLRPAQKMFANAWLCAAESPGISEFVVDPDQINIYVWLLTNSHESTFGSLFPMTAKLLGSGWRQLVVDCLAVRPPRNYSVMGVGQQFKQFVDDYQGPLLQQMPFLKELVEFEYLKFWHTNLSPTVSLSLTDLPKTLEELSALKPIIHPSLDIRTFQYPLIEIAGKLNALSAEALAENECWLEQFAEFCCRESTETYIVFLRTSEHQECRPIALSRLAVSLVEDAMETGDSYFELLRRHCGRIPVGDPSKQMRQALKLLSLMHEMGLFVDKVPLLSDTSPVAATS